MDQDFPVVYVRPGEMHCTDQPALVITVLGSCLAITMYSRTLGVGGISHSLLPSCSHFKGCKRECPEKLRYVDCSIRHMLRLFERLGARRSELEVKCFGGADMFSKFIEKRGVLSVGRQNTAMAEMIIRKEGLNMVSRDVGGRLGRKIFFYTQSGDVLLKRLTQTDDPDIRW